MHDMGIADAVGGAARLPIVTVAAASAAIANRLSFFIMSLQGKPHSKTDASAATHRGHCRIGHSCCEHAAVAFADGVITLSAR